MSEPQRTKISQKVAREAIEHVRVLVRYIECIGPPDCEPVSIDVQTGKREGGLCVRCEAHDWLYNRDR